MRIGEVLAIPSSDNNYMEIIKKLNPEFEKRNLVPQVKDGNIYISKGEGKKICLLVAIEGGLEKEENFKVVKLPKSHSWIAYNNYGRQVQIGANKIGIFLALKALDKLPNVKVIFTLERYGKGNNNTYAALYRLDKKFLEDVQCIISLDGEDNRTYSIDAGRTFSLGSEEFFRKLKLVADKNKFIYTSASYTSMGVCVKDDGVIPSAVVLGVGIQETDTEFEFISEMGTMSALEFILDLANSIGDEEFPFDSYEEK